MLFNEIVSYVQKGEFVLKFFDETLIRTDVFCYDETFYSAVKIL